jgi:hypothetical protein
MIHRASRLMTFIGTRTGLVTVPLLLMELIYVMALPRAKTNSLITRAW